MKRKLALTAILAVALAVVGYAQKPDFSGAWAPDAAAAPAPPAGGGGGGGGRGGGLAGPMTVTQKGDTLTIERTMGDLSDGARAKVLGLNAARLFGFPVRSA